MLRARLYFTENMYVCLGSGLFVSVRTLNLTYQVPVSDKKQTVHKTSQ